MDRNTRTSRAIVDYFDRGYRIIDGRFANPDINHSYVIYKEKLTGYMYANVCETPGSNITIRIPMHGFVAYHKFGDAIFNTPGNLVHVRHHPDPSRDNYSYDNILIGSPKENHADQPYDVEIKGRLRSIEARRRYSDETGLSMIKDHESGMRLSEISKKYGIAAGLVRKFFVSSDIGKRLGARLLYDEKPELFEGSLSRIHNNIDPVSDIEKWWIRFYYFNSYGWSQNALALYFGRSQRTIKSILENLE